MAAPTPTPNPSLWFLRLRTPAGIAGARKYTAEKGATPARKPAAKTARRR